MLTQRRTDILRIIVSEYISSTTPVASETVVLKYGLALSPATVRHEMAALEQEGYVRRPHTSAGAVPEDKGYRWYVETVAEETELPWEEQRSIGREFRRVEREPEEWARLAAAILSQLAGNVAVTTFPKATACLFKHLELVSLNDALALLILILSEARLKREMLPLQEPVSQEELSRAAQRLNALWAGLNSSQVARMRLEPGPLLTQIKKAVVHLMQGEERRVGDLWVDGLRHTLAQPEFASRERARVLLEILEEKTHLGSLLTNLVVGEGIRVVIGEENPEDALRYCSVVVTRYGTPGGVSGVLSVVGPTRMRYERAIGTVRCLASTMGKLWSQIYS